MNDERYHSSLVKHGRKKQAFAGSGKSYCYWIVTSWQPLAAAFFSHFNIGLHLQLSTTLQVVIPCSRMMLLSEKPNILMLIGLS